MYSKEQEEQFQQIFEELGKSLDTTSSQYESAVKSYEFVGNWLARDESPLAPFRPEVSPQGSFLLGTSIRPVQEDDDFDVDLVLRLGGKPGHWTQQHLKREVGRQLKSNGLFDKQLQPEGRRCWTLAHSDGAKFHMDILPAVSMPQFSKVLEKSFSADELWKAEQLVFSLTDNKMLNYATATDALLWPKTNPFGYAIWFEQRASISVMKAKLMSEAIKPLPKFKTDKLPLIRIVQILKRHRDIMFNGDEDKPISIVITTLAALAYRKETNILVGLTNVLNRIEDFIKSRWDSMRGKEIKWIGNPVNDVENFADKWPDFPQREYKFYQWLDQVKKDIAQTAKRSGLHRIQEGLSAPFGEKAVNRAFSAIGRQANELRESGKMRMAAGTGTIGTVGRTPIPKHTNHGSTE